MQEVIVYRNPAEAAFWNLMMSSPNMFPIGVGIVVFFVVLLVTDRFFRSSKFRNIRQFGNSYASLILGAIVGIAITWWMWV